MTLRAGGRDGDGQGIGDEATEVLGRGGDAGDVAIERGEKEELVRDLLNTFRCNEQGLFLINPILV